jgi:hypothetical protein
VSKLLDPGLGELTDRLSILGLKILSAEKTGRPFAHFVIERTAILSRLALMQPAVRLSADLYRVNSQLWEAEDRLRASRGDWDDIEYLREVTRLAFGIQALNDERSQLIAQLNGQSTDTEKLHG